MGRCKSPIGRLALPDFNRYGCCQSCFGIFTWVRPTAGSRHTLRSLRNIQSRRRALDKSTDTGSHMRMDRHRDQDSRAEAAGPASPFLGGLEESANRNLIASRVETQIDYSLWRSSRAPASGRKGLFQEESLLVCRAWTLRA